MTPEIGRILESITCPRCLGNLCLSLDLHEHTVDENQKLFQRFQLRCSSCGPYVVENLALNVELFAELSERKDKALQDALNYLVDELYIQACIKDPEED